MVAYSDQLIMGKLYLSSIRTCGLVAYYIAICMGISFPGHCMLMMVVASVMIMACHGSFMIIHLFLVYKEGEGVYLVKYTFSVTT